VPAKQRIAKRRPMFHPDTLALFRKLDRNPRQREAFSGGALRLAEALGLEAEFWTGNSPLDRRPAPHRLPGCCAFGDWHTCRNIRKALLEALAIAADDEAARCKSG
jgi:hypothetical protein